MKFLTMEDQLKYYRNKRTKKQVLESYFLSSGFQYIEPSMLTLYAGDGQGERKKSQRLVKVIDGKGEIYTMRGDMTAGIIDQIGQQAIESNEIKLYYDGKVFMTNEEGRVVTRDQMGVEWIGGDVLASTQSLIKLSAQ
ncbi:MAG: ATP phosphoribosyltransferase regulatory subunit, partial [Clostridia bacterium]|nr:ATP phosphoribosyltransferase regulatory subunit [Clostridia bacterium]